MSVATRASRTRCVSNPCRTVTTLLVKESPVRLTLLLTAVLVQFGCANRICQTKNLKMQWADGTTSTMQIVVCRPLIAWR
jgi:hypothetical protein